MDGGETVEDIFRRCYGLPCWGVTGGGYGTFLTLEFGRPSLEVREPRLLGGPVVKDVEPPRGADVNGWAAHPEVFVPMEWMSTGDSRCPYFQVVDGINWEIWSRDSDEGEPVIYTLTIGGSEVLDFDVDDWPSCWAY